VRELAKLAQPDRGWACGGCERFRRPRRHRPQIERELAAFREGLKETSYVEGQNVAIENRRGEGHLDRLPALGQTSLAARLM
jgi:hypothetical protein